MAVPGIQVAAPGADMVVRARDLVVDRGRKRVLHGISTAVPRGTVTGLIGPSGGGKTTLLRAIVGVQQLRSGHLEVLGETAGAAGLRRRVGYVTQAPSIYSDLTVRENVRYFASLYAGTDDADVARVIGDVGLTTAAGQLVGSLSGEELWQRFHDLARSGRTLLVSSHVMDEAAHCDRLILLREGRVVADGTVAEVRRMAGTEDLEEAFLRLIKGRPSGADMAAGDGPMAARG
jgi:ABC-2 type transport system ATP-binding protein